VDYKNRKQQQLKQCGSNDLDLYNFFYKVLDLKMFFCTQKHNIEARSNKFSQKTTLENFKQLKSREQTANKAT